MKQDVFISADVMAVDTPNKNGRIYPREIIQKAISDAKFPMMCSFGMPEAPTIDLASVSHMVTEMAIDENNHLIAQVKVLNTPMGQELMRMIADDAARDQIAFRSAGIGKTDENGVVTEFQFTSISVVPKDSAS